MWEKLKRIPVGLWAAIGVGLSLLVLYLRGRRLEAELARARVDQTVAQAHAGIAKSQGRAEVHMERAKEAERRIERIESARELVTMSGKSEEKRLASLEPDKVHEEYMQLLALKRAELGFDKDRSRAQRELDDTDNVDIREHLETEKKKRESIPDSEPGES